ncbi:hypothetical protein LEP1GSC190_01470 [Leptospira mayottensis 200901116]|nr:hypothetical protein LEP1GSC190_01470 [Leptospira mayottensis 200901116]
MRAFVSVYCRFKKIFLIEATRRKPRETSSIRKSYFLQVKSMILVGTLEKTCVLDSYYFKIPLNL